jgi:hypothetical protein
MTDFIRLPNVIIEMDDVKCYLEYGRYADPPNIFIRLMTCEDDEVYLKATTNGPYELNDDEVLIKNWTENRGIEAILVAAGVLGTLKSDNPYPLYVLKKKPVGIPPKPTRK